MKKLFALVLTLALVFAIAAPAMAAWGPVAPTVGSPYVVKVTRLQKNTDSYGNPYYTAYPDGVGVVAASPVYFQVDMTVPTDAVVAAYYPNPTTAGAFTAAITVKNIAGMKLISELKDGAAVATAGDVVTAPTTAVAADAIALKTSTFQANATADSIVYTAIFSGVVTATKDASVTASLGYTATDKLPLTKTVAGVTYAFAAPGATSATITGDETTNPTIMTLTLKDDVVTGMTLSVGGTVYTVFAGPAFMTSGTPVTQLQPTDAAYATVLAKYNALTGLLGFKAGDANINYTTANVLANLGYTNKATAVGTWKGFTATLTVTDGTAVPNTGDNMSVIGFVMVGLAVLATAAVVVKKVRA